MNKYLDTFYDWWKNIDKFLLFLILGLFLLGLFFSLVSTSLIASDKLDTKSYYFFFKHSVYIALAIAILIIFSFLNQKILTKLSLILFLFAFLSLLLVPFLGIEVKGSKRWLDLIFLPRFQPVEIVKPFFIVSLSLMLTIQNRRLYFKYFLSTLLILPILMLLAYQPDIGQTLLISMVWLALIFISGINIFIFFIFFIFVGSTVGYLVLSVTKFEYIKIRLFAFLDSNSGNNYQAEKASDAIINGGFFGKGIGEGTLNSRVPEAHTDYIVSVISEEFGAIIVIGILFLYLIFSYRVIQKINFVNEDLSKLILSGCISLILIQTFIHVGVNIRILPTTGMTLPFLSYGGSSIVSTAILSGLILNLTKRKLD
ncbi:FtsW/RodA/SpoVE family cell cycle protein [Pelagibacterales bacterium SAG-MED17]|nr:FtsW/RodA/SpoVE family cell cycle protein [Pelagibacterales bacterium SAG-MED17]